MEYLCRDFLKINIYEVKFCHTLSLHRLSFVGSLRNILMFISFKKLRLIYTFWFSPVASVCYTLFGLQSKEFGHTYYIQRISSDGSDTSLIEPLHPSFWLETQRNCSRPDPTIVQLPKNQIFDKAVKISLALYLFLLIKRLLLL